jgi:hypothetical protein
MTKRNNRGARCLWCGGQPVTREDVFPRWIGRELRKITPPGEPMHVTEVTKRNTGELVHFHRGTVGMAAGPRRPVVCRPCNGEWMSRTENAVKQVMTPLLLGNVPVGGVRLTIDEMTALSTWTIKTALVMDFASAGQTVAGQDLRRQFHETQRPLRTCRVWAGAYVPEQGDLEFWYKTPLGHQGDVAGEERLVMVTFGMGYLVLQTLIDTRVDMGGPPNRRPEPNDYMLEIWPRSAVSPDVWPPRRAMTRAQVEYFARPAPPLQSQLL